uniref:Uncharacterized protein n=1 Tax=Cucumis melo TaxID=3656 RepID=A0A9I9EH18_CUCME
DRKECGVTVPRVPTEERHWSVERKTLVVCLRWVLTFLRLLESSLINFHGFSCKLDENSKVFCQKSQQEENSNIKTLKESKPSILFLLSAHLPFIPKLEIKCPKNSLHFSSEISFYFQLSLSLSHHRIPPASIHALAAGCLCSSPASIRTMISGYLPLCAFFNPLLFLCLGFFFLIVRFCHFKEKAKQKSNKLYAISSTKRDARTVVGSPRTILTMVSMKTFRILQYLFPFPPFPRPRALIAFRLTF